MAKPHVHALVGAAAALVPDVALALFGWRKQWLPESHSLVRAHRMLHGPMGIGLAVAFGMISHIVLDRYSSHRAGPVTLPDYEPPNTVHRWGVEHGRERHPWSDGTMAKRR